MSVLSCMVTTDMMVDLMINHNVVACSVCTRVLCVEHKESKENYCLHKCLFKTMTPMPADQEAGPANELASDEELYPDLPSTGTPRVKTFITDLKYSDSLFLNDARVRITRVTDAKTYFVTATKDKQLLDELGRVLEYFAENAEYLRQPPVKNEIVLFVHHDKYHRAMVKAVDDDGTCSVRLIDSGHDKQCIYLDLKAVNEIALQLPIFSICVQLVDVPPPALGFSLNKIQFNAIIHGTYKLYWSMQEESMCMEKGIYGEVTLTDVDWDENLGATIVEFYNAIKTGVAVDETG